MCNNKILTITLTIFLTLLTGLSQTAMAATPYAQLASNQTQLADTINQGIVATLQNVDNLEEIDWDKEENKLIIKEDGVYFVMAVAQVGAREYGSALSDNGGDLSFWFALNDKVIANTGTWHHVSPQSKSNTIVDQYALPLKKGDALSFMFSASTTSIGMVTFRGTETRPSSPGLSVSVFKMGEIPE